MYFRQEVNKILQNTNFLEDIKKILKIVDLSRQILVLVVLDI